MRQMRLVGLCLTTALVLAAIGASSASALPEVGRCVAKAGGKYTNNNCTKKVTSGGSFEWLKGTGGGNKFTATSGEAVLEGESGTKIVCKNSTAVGKYDEDGTAHAIKGVESVVATFHECEDPGIGKICHSAGQLEGVIVTETLEGNLGYIVKKPAKVGQELHPAKKGGPFAVFECGLPSSGGIKVTVKENTSGAPGSKGGGNCIISTLTEVNVMATSVGDVFKASGIGKQDPQSFENKKPPICNLESEFAAFPAPFERSTQTEIAEVFSEEPLEIKA
jgi:hypothetical protein